MNKRLVAFIIIVLILILVSTSFNENKSRVKLTVFEMNNQHLFTFNLNFLIDSFESISETLKDYDEELTEKEIYFYYEGLNKEMRNLRQIENNLKIVLTVISQNENLDYYSTELWKTRSLLEQIVDEEIFNRAKVEDISNTLGKYVAKLRLIQLNQSRISKVEELALSIKELNEEIESIKNQ